MHGETSSLVTDTQPLRLGPSLLRMGPGTPCGSCRPYSLVVLFAVSPWFSGKQAGPWTAASPLLCRSSASPGRSLAQSSSASQVHKLLDPGPLPSNHTLLNTTKRMHHLAFCLSYLWEERLPECPVGAASSVTRLGWQPEPSRQVLDMAVTMTLRLCWMERPTQYVP